MKTFKYLLPFIFVFLFTAISVFATNYGFSYLFVDDSRLLIDSVGGACEDVKYGWFNYVTKASKTSKELAKEAPSISKKFYNYRNFVYPVEQDAYQYSDDLYSICPLDFFNSENTNDFNSCCIKLSIFNKEYFFNSENTNNHFIPVIISSDFAAKYAAQLDIGIEEILGRTLDNEHSATKDSKLIISGVWDKSYLKDYYRLNRFFVTLEQDTVFVNKNYISSISKSGVISTYLTFGNNVDANYSFLNYCRTISGFDFSIDSIDTPINNFKIGSFSKLNDFQKSLNVPRNDAIKILSILLIVIGFACLLISIVFLFVHLINGMSRFFKLCYACFLLNGLLFALILLSENIRKVFGLLYVNPLVLKVTIYFYLFILILLIFPSFKQDMVKQKQIVGKPTVLVIGFNGLKTRNASSVRILSYISMIKQHDTETIYVGFFNKSESEKDYVGINGKFKLLNYLFAPFRYARAIKNIARKTNIVSALVYSPLPIISSISVLSVLNRCQIPIFNDVCEYQSGSQFHIIKPGWFNLSNRFYNYCLISKNDSVFSISTYLDEYFRKKGAESSIIPPLFNPSRGQNHFTHRSILSFTYLGDPGKKDDLTTCVNGFLELFKQNKLDAVINFYGTNKKRFKCVLNNIPEEILNRFVFHKRVNSLDELKDVYKNTDFIFFLRNPRKRFARAGFPSKVVEAASYGVPTITNRSSDLTCYFRNNKTIYFADSNTKEGFCRSVMNAAKKTVKSSDLKKLVRDNFSVEKYSDIIYSRMIKPYSCYTEKKQKILMFANSVKDIISFRYDLVNCLLKNGFEVVFIVGEDGDRTKLSDLNIKIIECPYKNRSINPIENANVESRFRKIIFEEKPDIVFTFMAKANTLGVIAAHKAGIERIYSMAEGLGDPFQPKNLKGKILRYIVSNMYKHSMKYCKKLFVLNDDDKNELLQRKIVSENKIEVINGIGINSTMFEYNTKLTNEKRIINLSRLIANKGIINYCEIAREVRKARPDIHFDLYGSESELTINDIRQYIEDGSIEYKGFTTDPIKEIHESRLLMLCSYREGFSRTILEAMCCGIPVVATNVPGNKSAIINCQTGFLFEKNDVENVSKKIIEIIDDDKLLDYIRENAFERCKKSFDSKTINQIILKSLNE